MSGIKSIRGTFDKKKKKLRGRFVWLLETMCKACRVDVQMIDYQLDYFENKKNIEEQAHARLFLKPEKRVPEEEAREIESVVKSYRAA